MKTVLYCCLFLLGFSSFTFAQKNNLVLVNDIGKILMENDKQNPSKVLPIIFAKLGRKHRLARQNQAMETTITQLIAKRRSYRASGESRNMMYRAYDHLIAQLLSQKIPPRAEGIKCDASREKLQEWMNIYDDALKRYQNCVNGTSFSLNAQIPIIDGVLGGSAGSSGSNATSGSCGQLLQLVKDAANAIGRYGADVSRYCPDE